VVGPSSLQLLAIEETSKLATLKFDIWEWSIFALDDVIGGQDQFDVHPPHMLSMKDIWKVKDTHDLIVFGLEDGYC
jgi:hypothetical protein